MLTFLKLFAICIVGGFLFTSLVWIFFWMAGIFEVPATARKVLEFLHVARKEQYQEAVPDIAPLKIGLEGQAGTTVMRIRLYEGFSEMNAALNMGNTDNLHASSRS